MTDAVDTTAAAPAETSRYASRKFILAVLAVISATALVYFSKISDGVYSTIIVAALTAYFAANVAQKKVTS